MNDSVLIMEREGGAAPRVEGNGHEWDNLVFVGDPVVGSPSIGERSQITVLDESLEPLVFDRSGWTHF